MWAEIIENVLVLRLKLILAFNFRLCYAMQILFDEKHIEILIKSVGSKISLYFWNVRTISTPTSENVKGFNSSKILFPLIISMRFVAIYLRNNHIISSRNRLTFCLVRGSSLLISGLRPLIIH